jgi:hypothetical protein
MDKYNRRPTSSNPGWGECVAIILATSNAMYAFGATGAGILTFRFLYYRNGYAGQINYPDFKGG